MRVVTIGNDPWFSGMDVLDVLGLYPSEYRRLSDDQKTNLPRTQLGLAAGRSLVMLSESGLYKLVMRSDKPQAKRFQDWVTKDVLPAIRKAVQHMATGTPLAAPMRIVKSRCPHWLHLKRLVNVQMPTSRPTILINSAGVLSTWR
ncbi:Bro-N domain-containing protein [Thalassospira lucentensis]|uniref:BRO-N domain-containing protein n=1 Tax=Thalassospira lucentensis TaxID=168935 RepID=UPI003AA91331